MRARRVIAYAPRTLEWEEIELPDTPPPGKLLVRTAATLISTGTELANWTAITADRVGRSADWRDRPLRLGYSLAGTVVAVGDGVGDWQPGDRVSGAGPHASAAVMDAARCVKIPAGVSDADATFGTLGPIALNGVRRASIELGESVAVVGLGLIGQMAGLWSRLDGARPVVGLDYFAPRRQLAMELGMAAAFDAADAEAVPRAVQEWTEHANRNPGFDVVIEATGHPAALLPALRLARDDGRVVALGSTRGVVEQFDLYAEVHKRGIVLIGAHNSTHPAQANSWNRWTEPANRALTLRLIASGDLPVGRLVSHRVPARQAPELYALLADRRQEAMGVVLDWQTA